MKKNNKKQYYSLYQEEDTAVLNIFGDITSWAWEELGEMSNVLLSKKLEELGDVSVIDVYINSYGGEVAEGLAIYNALKRHKAKIRTHVDGFACSIASVIFMAGDERIMPSTSCLMIHNPWTVTAGNAKELRKQAEDLDVIGECSINAYMEHVNISEDELKELLDNETWLSSKEAVEKGFATEVDESEESDNVSQSVKGKVIEMLLKNNVKQECNSNFLEETTEEPPKEEDNVSTEDMSSDNTSLNADEEQEQNNEAEEVATVEETEDGKNPSEKATKIVAAFLNNLEKEILK